MIVLGIESSATAASVAIINNEKLVCEFFSDTGLTHSQTLLPMVENCLKAANITTDEIDSIAVANGPGSFTGVRIGIATVKGLAFTNDIPCTAVSTLEGIAHNIPYFDGIICSVMDARCNQVYTAFFEGTTECKVNRLSDDTAMSIDELGENIKKYGKSVILVGDGAEICYNKLKNSVSSLYLSPLNLRKQRASSVAYCSLNHEKQKADELNVNYIRLPQAQRELAKKRNLNNNN